jgi:hypothetical protein
LANAPAGSYLGVVEVSEQRAKVLSVLDRGFDVGRKLSPAGLPATGAVFDFGLMLGAFQLQRGKVEDLATLNLPHRLLGKILAAPTLSQGMNPRVLGIFDPLKRVTGMTGLTTAGTPGLFAQALGLGFFRPVRGRGA